MPASPPVSEGRIHAILQTPARLGLSQSVTGGIGRPIGFR